MKNIFYVILFLILITNHITSTTITVSSLSPDRWREYRALRLQALKEDPVAFTVDVADEESKSDEYWQQRLVDAQENNNFWLLFAEHEGELIGMVGALQEYEHYTYSRHLATITSMYVAPNWRGHGVGKLLMHEVMAALRRNDAVSVVLLWVTQGKMSAIKLYERCGFIKTGVMQNSALINNQFYDLILMQRFL